jgi:hypothetical protein
MSSSLEVSLDQGFDFYFKRGDTISGKIKLINNHDLENCENLTATLFGEEEVHWAEKHISEPNNLKSSFISHKFEQTTNIFEIEKIIWKSKESKETIPTGEQEFNFSMNFPDCLFPSSMKSDYGKVSYFLKFSMKQLEVPKNNEEWDQLENILELKPIYDFSKKIEIQVNGCQVDEVLINMEKRNSPVIHSLEINEGFFVGKITMSVILNRDTFFTGENINLQVILCNGTSKTTDVVKYEFLKFKEYCYSRKTIVGRIKRRKEHVGIISSGIAATQILEHSRSENSVDINVPFDLAETTMIKNSIFRVSYMVFYF